jgi:hypothetical protein
VLSRKVLWISALAIALLSIGSIPMRTALCASRFDEVRVGDQVNDSPFVRHFTKAESPHRWLQAREEYHCSAWPVPKVWVIGVSDSQVVQKDVLVSP